MPRLRVLVPLVLLVLAWPGAARAHQSSVSYSQISVGDDGAVDYTVQLSTRDLYEALALDEDRDATNEEILAGKAALFAYVGDKLRVADGPTPCPLLPQGLQIVEQTDRFVKLRFLARCPGRIRLLAVDYDLFFDLDPRHTGMLQVSHAGETVQRELTTSASRFEWELGQAAPASTSFLDFVGSGVDHIFTGYDHVCFLLGLLLVAAIRVRDGRAVAQPPRRAALDVLKTVTAFTLAHSLTLIVAALGWLELSSRVVESAIAASIVYVAAENLLSETPRSRWPLAFGFGLVHGMGFASMLRPLLPASNVVPPLLAFNVGVELGQLAIVGAVLPLLLLAAHRSAAAYRRVVVWGGSALIGLFGLLWLVDRVFDVETLSRFL